MKLDPRLPEPEQSLLAPIFVFFAILSIFIGFVIALMVYNQNFLEIYITEAEIFKGYADSICLYP